MWHTRANRCTDYVHRRGDEECIADRSENCVVRHGMIVLEQEPPCDVAVEEGGTPLNSSQELMSSCINAGRDKLRNLPHIRNEEAEVSLEQSCRGIVKRIYFGCLG